jgi:hypothetical protein
LGNYLLIAETHTDPFLSSSPFGQRIFGMAQTNLFQIFSTKLKLLDKNVPAQKAANKAKQTKKNATKSGHGYKRSKQPSQTTTSLGANRN